MHKVLLVNIIQVSQASDEETTGNYTNSGDSGEFDASMKRIINFSMGTNNDTLVNIVGGMLGSTIISHDIYNKSYE